MISMMNNQAAAYEPLGIPPYQWWSEGLHGSSEPCVQYQDKCVCPTSFPCPSALGNAFNATLYHQIGAAIGKEGRAISNLRPHDLAVGDGLTYWSPTINMQRDPRWGRNQEGKVSKCPQGMILKMWFN
jgi:beta-glucosidase-like glycosyl hydrolase